MTAPSRKSGDLELRTFPSGPGFSLPSMSPDSLAAISYLQYANQMSNVEWKNVKDSESSQTKNLDSVLNCICGTEVSGLTSIISHLKSCSSLDGKASLDDWMNGDENADCEAWTSLVLTTGRELIDLYLYVTSANYFSTTRPAYSTIFPLHINYIIPPAHRKLALGRTEHLGMEEILKLSNEEEEEERAVKVQNNVSSNLPDRFNLGKRKNEISPSQRRFHLEKLIARSVGPFAELLGEKRFTMSNDRPCSLDAIILGYYGMILNVKVSDPWAANTIRQKYPTLAKWVDKNSHDIFSQLL